MVAVRVVRDDVQWHAGSASQLPPTERFVVFHSAQVMLMIGSSISAEGAIGSQAVCEQREGWA